MQEQAGNGSDPRELPDTNANHQKQRRVQQLQTVRQ